MQNRDRLASRGDAGGERKTPCEFVTWITCRKTVSINICTYPSCSLTSDKLWQWPVYAPHASVQIIQFHVWQAVCIHYCVACLEHHRIKRAKTTKTIVRMHWSYFKAYMHLVLAPLAWFCGVWIDVCLKLIIKIWSLHAHNCFFVVLAYQMLPAYIANILEISAS